MDTTTAISIFQFVIETLGHVQLAREFEDNFATYQLKLNILQLRLSRWGEIANISTIDNADKDANESGKGSKGNGPSLVDVKEVLEGIQTRMELAKKETSRLQKKITGTSSQVVEVESNFQGDLKKIRDQFMNFLRKRKVQVSKAIESIKWAFYKKEQFDKFIADISELLNELEETIPEADREKLLKLSDDECKGLDKSDLEVLKPILGGCDPWLERSVDMQLGVQDAGNVINQSNNTGHTVGIHNGDNKGITHGNNNTQTNTFN